MEEIKEELIYLINRKLKAGEFSTREIIKRFPFVNSMMLNRLSHYQVEDFKADKLIDIINKIDTIIHSKTFGFSVSFDSKNKQLTLIYGGTSL